VAFAHSADAEGTGATSRRDIAAQIAAGPFFLLSLGLNTNNFKI
jgi:hypothetical protein